eukprot:4644087-Pyramimonas_sp.AAC.1
MEGLAKLGAGISLTPPANFTRRPMTSEPAGLEGDVISFLFSAKARRGAVATVVWLMRQRRAYPPTKCRTSSKARKSAHPFG